MTRVPFEPVILGVDPGGRTTGLALRQGRKVLGWQLVNRHPNHSLPFADGLVPSGEYVHAVLEEIDKIRSTSPGKVRIAVEGVVRPNGHIRRIDSSGVMGVSFVLGGILTVHTDAIVVRPAGHGSAFLTSYPPELVGVREKGRIGSGALRHCRSAYDIAGAARTMLRIPSMAVAR
jgi:hypothetical protein